MIINTEDKTIKITQGENFGDIYDALRGLGVRKKDFGDWTILTVQWEINKAPYSYPSYVDLMPHTISCNNDCAGTVFGWSANVTNKK